MTNLEYHKAHLQEICRSQGKDWRTTPMGRAIQLVEAVIVLNEERPSCPLCGSFQPSKPHFKDCPLAWWEQSVEGESNGH